MRPHEQGDVQIPLPGQLLQSLRRRVENLGLRIARMTGAQGRRRIEIGNRLGKKQHQLVPDIVGRMPDPHGHRLPLLPGFPLRPLVEGGLTGHDQAIGGKSQLDHFGPSPIVHHRDAIRQKGEPVAFIRKARPVVRPEIQHGQRGNPGSAAFRHHALFPIHAIHRGRGQQDIGPKILKPATGPLLVRTFPQLVKSQRGFGKNRPRLSIRQHLNFPPASRLFHASKNGNKRGGPARVSGNGQDPGGRAVAASVHASSTRLPQAAERKQASAIRAAASPSSPPHAGDRPERKASARSSTACSNKSRR